MPQTPAKNQPPMSHTVGLPPSQFSADDGRHFRAACGFFDLDLYETWEELETNWPTGRAGTEVLTLRVDLLLAKEHTDLARIVAAGIVRMHPEHAPGHYALALVVARAGNISGARGALTAAFEANSELTLVALEDARLDDYWRTLGA